MTELKTVPCERCGNPTGPNDVVRRHSPGDPLQVTECGQCGSILSIGGHDW